jgi:hypothetical protein
MCDECASLQKRHVETTERLLAAQRDLARHGANRNGEFERLWSECQTSLKTLWSLRQEMERHVCTVSAHAN